MALALCAAPAAAILDIEDRGPVLDAGGFRMRVTNVGVVGNAFLDAGRSFDPSFEFPPHSGVEMLNYASLWVGGIDDRGRQRVSGGPLLEFRPTLDPDDRVLSIRRGEPGTRWRFDDDGDGRVDEEILNNRDDDGDGVIDEDLGFTADHLMTAEYVDDRPEAVNFLYETGESHVPLGIAVHQEAYAWSRPGFEKIAGLQYTITNTSSRTLRGIYVGLLTDLDVTERSDRTGHLNDRVKSATFSRTFNDGIGLNIITINGAVPQPSAGPPPPPAACISTVSRTVPVLYDGADASRPRAAVIPLDHTTDPLARIGPVASHARAPATVSFRTSVFSRDGVPGQGGLPRLDADRYRALRGQLPQSVEDRDDHVVLISCGPFDRLEPGQSIQFHAAIVAGENDDSLATVASNAIYLHRGITLNLQPDYRGRDSTEYNQGATGINGHEVCIAAPPGVTFQWDPHCVNKFPEDSRPFPPPSVTYTPGPCIWTDADCDPCTGFRGRETVLRWLDPGQVPPAPGWTRDAGDRVVHLAWDNAPEVLLAGNQYGTPISRFLGYRIYRMADWRNRKGLLPPLSNWSLVSAFGPDSVNGEIPLATVTDTTVSPITTLFGRPLYPPGRYRFVDRTPLNGFDYLYAVTSLYELKVLAGASEPEVSVLESPIVATFADRVAPRAEARGDAAGVWVVPNPYRGTAGWNRPVALGDPRPRHIDFMGMPRARATVKIWTVAGDLVAELQHDGREGDGQLAWDLISRNGQDVESGIYLFTVESALGRSTGRFVVIR